MAARANWKGVLKVAEVACPVALYTAVSTSERIAFHTLNRDTKNRVRREYIDGETGKPVDRGNQVMGYAVAKDEYVILQPDEIAAAVPESDKTLAVSAFLALGDVDDLYLDTPYFLAPADRGGEQAFALLRDGLSTANVAAVARTVLHRRVRTLLIRAHGSGMIATTLHFDYEARSAKAAFQRLSDARIADEMLELAEHIIKTKRGRFDPSRFEDRYEHALAELVKAKAEGKAIAPPPRPKTTPTGDLLTALRQSAGADTGRAGKRPPRRQKAG